MNNWRVGIAGGIMGLCLLQELLSPCSLYLTCISLGTEISGCLIIGGCPLLWRGWNNLIYTHHYHSKIKQFPNSQTHLATKIVEGTVGVWRKVAGKRYFWKHLYFKTHWNGSCVASVLTEAANVFARFKFRKLEMTWETDHLSYLHLTQGITM